MPFRTSFLFKQRFNILPTGSGINTNMAFWGVQIKEGTSFTLSSHNSHGRLKITQATLGMGNNEGKTMVECSVGRKSPIMICCFIPEVRESCQLDLEFEEAEQVTFSVIGRRNVHLSGYFPHNASRNLVGDHKNEPDGEDLGSTDTDTDTDTLMSDECSSDDSFINDGELDLYSDSDEEANKKNKPKKGSRKRSKKKFWVSDSEDDDASWELKGTTTSTNEGLIVEELESGKQHGGVASSGNKVTVHYIGKLKEGGKIFDSSCGKNPLTFRIGDDAVIDGLDKGIIGMRVGGKRRLQIPPALGFGSEGTDRVPPDSWLVMEVQLLKLHS